MECDFYLSQKKYPAFFKKEENLIVRYYLKFCNKHGEKIPQLIFKNFNIT